jgi:lysozyme
MPTMGRRMERTERVFFMVDSTPLSYFCRILGVKTSKKGIQFIADEEGFVGYVYKDIAGVPTIGYGHRLLPGEVFTTTITREKALEILQKDVGSAESTVNKCVKVPLNQNQFDSIVSFTFNLGGGALKSSTLLQLLNKGDYQGAANEFPRWCKAVIKGVLTVSPTLQKRRNLEKKIFLTPVEVPPVAPVVAPVQGVVVQNPPLVTPAQTNEAIPTSPVVPNVPTPEPKHNPKPPTQSWWIQLLNNLAKVFSR